MLYLSQSLFLFLGLPYEVAYSIEKLADIPFPDLFDRCTGFLGTPGYQSENAPFRVVSI